MKTKIKLSPDQLIAASSVGCYQRIMSIFRRTQQQHYVSDDNSEWSTEIEARAAEIAFSELTGQRWSGLDFNGEVSHNDVGSDNVRHTSYKHGHLLLYPEDNDNGIFVLMWGVAPNYEFLGFGRKNKLVKPELWKNKGDKTRWGHKVKSDSWWIPQSALATPQQYEELRLTK